MCGHRRRGWTRFEREMRVAGRDLERGLREAGEEIAATGREINDELNGLGDELNAECGDTPRRRSRGSSSYGFGAWTSHWTSHWPGKAERKAERRERRAERRHERKAARRQARRDAHRQRTMGPLGWLANYWWLVFPLYFGVPALWENVGSSLSSGMSALVTGLLNVTPAGPLAHLISSGTGLSFTEAFGLLALAAGVTGVAAWIGLQGMPKRAPPPY